VRVVGANPVKPNEGVVRNMFFTELIGLRSRSIFNHWLTGCLIVAALYDRLNIGAATVEPKIMPFLGSSTTANTT